MSKRTQEDASEDRVTAKSKPIMNLVPRCRVEGSNRTCLDSIWKPGEKKAESLNVPLSSLNVQQTSTVRPALGAGSSNYSEWNIDDKWFSQEWKSGEMSNTSTERPVHDKFFIEDDMDSDTAAESFPEITFILEHSEWPIAKDVGPFSRRFKARHWQTFFDLGECLCRRHWKHLYWWERITQTIYRRKSHFKANVRDFWTVDVGTIRWDFWSVSIQLGKGLHGNSLLWSMMKKSSVSRMHSFVYFQILCYVLKRWIRTQH